MNNELKTWCDFASEEMNTEKGNGTMNTIINIVNKHWIIFNPITVMAVAFALVAVVFALLGWAE